MRVQVVSTFSTSIPLNSNFLISVDAFSLKPRIEIQSCSSITKASFHFNYCGRMASWRFNIFEIPDENSTLERLFWVNLEHLVLRYCGVHLNILTRILNVFPNWKTLNSYASVALKLLNLWRKSLRSTAWSIPLKFLNSDRLKEINQRCGQLNTF